MAKSKIAVVMPPEVEQKEQEEKEAVEDFKKAAKEAIDIIEQNHFHLRLWKAVGGES